MAAPPPIGITSLQQAVERIIDFPGGVHREAHIHSMQPGHGAAAVHLLHRLISRRRWSVVPYRRLTNFADAGSLLLIIADGVLPVVVPGPRYNAALELVERFANKLVTLAGGIGGTFQLEYQGLHPHVTAFLALARTPGVPAATVIDRADQLRARLRDLLDTVVTLTVPAGPTPAPAEMFPFQGEGDAEAEADAAAPTSGRSDADAEAWRKRGTVSSSPICRRPWEREPAGDLKLAIGPTPSPPAFPALRHACVRPQDDRERLWGAPRGPPPPPRPGPAPFLTRLCCSALLAGAAGEAAHRGAERGDAVAGVPALAHRRDHLRVAAAVRAADAGESRRPGAGTGGREGRRRGRMRGRRAQARAPLAFREGHQVLC
ncbi:hypothetical protein BS78_07G017100 [Paspalum vaginatum]|nr:hypothetical protein BS78_07G017100 [Paspalum vaginatum]KAJ1266920.1 hypothetical protein BS78_07G017100 [Paspalum vaginatum]KAJ1266921.1 hypothetical protein BS78_07G017100 [Paspalum vaginatum]KAJ1266922.1 hypothetical protein BS78_07G017100 [Paspalum vaginatum]KAJ1266923.1 hypothetical protein BS78_07G017100 [Paspalum vaginatum]